MRAPASILVIKPSSFGDVVHTFPAVAMLKAAWPEARLDWVINPEWSPLLDENPSVDRKILFPRRDFRGLRGILRFKRWCREQLAANRYDLAVDFQGLLRSAWMGRASGAKTFVGMSDAREGAGWFYNKTAAIPGGVVHSVERYLATADFALGYLPARREAVFSLPSGDPVESLSLREDARFVLLHPFSRGAGKSLSDELLQQLCLRLAPLRTLLVGRRETPLRFDPPSSCTNLLNATSLRQLVWLTRRASAVITVDSGPSHLAAALNRPLVALHTWSDPRKVGPYRHEAWVWKNGKLAPMREMRREPETFFRQPSPIFQERDVAAVAELATALSSSCA